MLMLLQEHGRMTAAALSEELEVSPRTVLRDVGALAFAGVPIHTVRGITGGIELGEGFTSQLTGLGPSEAACLPLVGLPQLAVPLGFARETANARHKLLQALGEESQARVAGLSDWLHIDVGKAGTAPPHDRLARVLHAIKARRVIRVRLTDEPDQTMQPLGLVAAASGWFVVGDMEVGRVALALGDLNELSVSNDRFERPDDVSLPTDWQAAVGLGVG